MPNIASVLKHEIGRIARKAVRQETAALKRASAIYLSEIASLKRRVTDTERQLRAGGRRTQSVPVAADDESIPEHTRLSAKGLAGHRRRLRLSASDLGLLLGVSTQTIYNWESSKARPHRKLLPTLVALRTVGK